MSRSTPAANLQSQTQPLLILTGIVAATLAVFAGSVPLGGLLPTALGGVTLVLLAVSLILAARWGITDRVLGGPDKAYVVHRYAGMGAMLALVGHWITADDVGAGLIPALANGAGDLGTPVAIGFVVLSVLSALRAVPYHLWKLSHMAMGPLFGVAAYHSLLSASPMAPGGPAWMLCAGVSALGALSYGRILLRGRAKGTQARVTGLTRLADAVEITLTADAPLPAYRAGQFATLACPALGAETHPFTIAGGTGTQRRFAIRAGGDWTADLHRSLRIGDSLSLGAPQGRFQPRTNAARPAQLWVAGGVGITPFLAALETMTPDDGAPVTLIYCHSGRDTAVAIDRLVALAAPLPQVTLIERDSSLGQRLDGDSLRALLAALPRRCDLYLCGSDGLKDMVRAQWTAAGKRGRSHDEAFDFRGGWTLPQLAGSAQRHLVPAAHWIAARALPLIAAKTPRSAAATSRAWPHHGLKAINPTGKGERA